MAKMKFETLKDIYTHSLASFPDRPALRMYEGESLTYAEFGRRVERVKKTLLEAGLSAGDRMALLSGNAPNWSVCYFAAVTAGIVVVPILPDFSSDELGSILEHCGAKALAVSDKLFAKVPSKVLSRMNAVIRTRNLALVNGGGPAAEGRAKTPAADDLAVIIYTSGTTSKPKGVMLTHGNLCSQLGMVYDLFRVEADDVFLSILPLSHTYECSFGMLYPFMVGASVVYLDRPPTVTYLLPALSAVRPTIMLTVPLIIEKIFRSRVLARFGRNGFVAAFYRQAPVRRLIHRMAGRRLKKMFGGRVRFFGIGGAKLDTEAERFLLEARFPYAIGYGLTETAPLIAGAVPGKVRLGSTGPVMHGIQARVENVNPATGEGEIVVKSPSTMQGYYHDPEATRSVFTADGWFRTKDLGVFDADGYLYIKGRLNNMIVGPSGENIYPEDIESVINTHALVQESLVREERGRLVAVVKFDPSALERKYYDLKDNLSAKMEDIKRDVMKYVNSKVSRYSRISVVVEQKKDFEKTPTQKIKRYLYIKKGGSVH